MRDVEAAAASALASPHAFSRREDSAAPDDVGLFRPFFAFACLAVVVLLFVFESRLRDLEAAVSVHVVHLFGIGSAFRQGTSVIFDNNGAPIGYTLTLGCTAAFLVVPFFIATSALLAIRRVPVVRSVSSLAIAIVTILAFNQLRLLTIALAMKVWGADTGYARTHVLVGTLISTVGVICAGIAYLAILLRGTYTDTRSEL